MKKINARNAFSFSETLFSVFVLEEKNQSSKYFTVETAYRVSAKYVCVHVYKYMFEKLM